MARHVALVLVLLAAALSVVWSAVAAPRVLPRARIAPGFALVDASGTRVSSDSLRGQIVLVTFGPAECDENCRDWSASIAEQLSDVAIDQPVTSLWIVGEPVSPPALEAVAGALAESPIPWRVVGTQDARDLELVLAGFRVPRAGIASGGPIEPVVVVIDPTGIVRAEYRTTAAIRALPGDLAALDREIRESRGFRRYLYEAAHLFTCTVEGA